MSVAITIAMLTSTVAIFTRIASAHAGQTVAGELERRDQTPQAEISASTDRTKIAPLDMSEALTEDVDDDCALVAVAFICPSIASWTEPPPARQTVARQHSCGPQRPPRG